MIQISPGITLEILWHDEYVTEIRFSISNKVFSGSVKAYLDREQLTSFANGLTGFPKNNIDERTYSFGAPDESQAGGGAYFRFFCIDGLAHIGVEVSLRSDVHTPSKRSERCTAFIPLEPAAIDNFTTQLRSMEFKPGESICLPLAP